jgi:hypothetical protein
MHPFLTVQNNTTILMLNTIMMMGVLSCNQERNPGIVEQRLLWDTFTGKYGDRPDFVRSIRMKLESFNLLLSCIRNDLEVDELQASRRGTPILPELCLFCTIRYLAGASYLDIRFLTGISVASVYRIIWKTIKALVNCAELKLKFPSTQDELKAAAMGFESVSTGGCISNCVSVIDGYHLAIITPPKKYAKNVQSFFSGHYQSHGFNIQAACDHSCRFQFIAVAGPGVMGDRDAINEVELGNLIEDLPGLYCAIGDCAYKASEHLVPIFGGTNALVEKNDNFNFFASQLRIRIEMSFGLMVKKWGILQRPLTNKLSHVKYIVTAIAMLHNFCINCRLADEATDTVFTPQNYELPPFEEALRATAAEFECEDITSLLEKNHSLNRQRMVETVYSMGVTHPGKKNNKKRKRN